MQRRRQKYNGCSTCKGITTTQSHLLESNRIYWLTFYLDRVEFVHRQHSPTWEMVPAFSMASIRRLHISRKHLHDIQRRCILSLDISLLAHSLLWWEHTWSDQCQCQQQVKIPYWETHSSKKSGGNSWPHVEESNQPCTLDSSCWSAVQSVSIYHRLESAVSVSWLDWWLVNHQFHLRVRINHRAHWVDSGGKKEKDRKKLKVQESSASVHWSVGQMLNPGFYFCSLNSRTLSRHPDSIFGRKPVHSSSDATKLIPWVDRGLIAIHRSQISLELWSGWDGCSLHLLSILIRMLTQPRCRRSTFRKLSSFSNN